MISIQIAEGGQAIEAIADEWDALVRGTPNAALSGPFWYLAAVDAFAPERIAIITARLEGRLVGILPFARMRTDARGLYFRLVAPLARGDYQPLIAAPESIQEVLPAMMEASFDHFGRRGVYWWPNIPEDDPSLALLRSFFAVRGMPSFEEREIAPRLAFEGGDFAAVEQGWPSSHRKDVRRQRKRLAERGAVSLWQPASREEAESVLEEFFRVHDAKWLADGYPGMFQDAANRRHYYAIVRRLWGRGLHFSTVRCGPVDVAYHLGFFAGGWLQWYRPTYRPEYGVLSPGKIHVAMLAEAGCGQGWKGIDFLLGAESYKDVWSNRSAEVVSIHAGFHRWSPSYFWFSRGKPFTRQRLQMTYLRTRAWLQKQRLRLGAA